MKRILLILIVAVFPFLEISAQEVTQKYRALKPMNTMVEVFNEMCPVSAVIYNINSCRYCDGCLTYVCVFEDNTVFDYVKEYKTGMKNLLVTNLDLKNPALKYNLLLLADLDASLRYLLYNANGTEYFEINISNEDILGMLGGEVTQELRVNSSNEYMTPFMAELSLDIRTDDSGFVLRSPFEGSVSECSEKMLLDELKESVMTTFTEGDASAMLFYHSMYLNKDFVCEFECYDGTFTLTIPCEEIEQMSLVADKMNEATVDPAPKKLDFDARFMGGSLNDFSTYVSQNLVYPKNARRKGIQGTVALSFVVDTDGKIQDIKVLSSPNKLLTKEALRVVRKSPKEWSPAIYDGSPCRVRYNLPVIFRLQ